MISKLTIIGSDNGLSPDRRQAIILTNAGILLVGPLGTNFNEIVIEIDAFSFTKMHLKIASGKWRPFCLGLNVLIYLVVLLLTLDAVWIGHRVIKHALRSSLTITSYTTYTGKNISLSCKRMLTIMQSIWAKCFRQGLENAKMNQVIFHLFPVQYFQ